MPCHYALVSRFFSSGLPVLRFAMSCGFGVEGMSADYVAQFTLDAPATVNLAPSDGSSVAIRRGCDESAERLCAPAHDPSLSGIELEAGTWYVLLQTFGGPQAPQVLLTVQ